jgi:hypothetical protein
MNMATLRRPFHFGANLVPSQIEELNCNRYWFPLVPIFRAALGDGSVCGEESPRKH